MVLFVVIGLFLPQKVHVERSLVIDRPASTVFVVLNDFQAYDVWSPLASRDPGIEYRYSGPSSGVGARLEWIGDPRQVGKGWQEIIESIPYTRIRMQLDFEQQGRGTTEFAIEAMGASSRVTWGFDTDVVEGQGWFGSLLARYFGLFFDRWLGSDYEQGLERLKRYVETLPATDFSDLDAQIVRVEPFDILYVPTGIQPGQGDVATRLANAYQEIIAFMAQHGIEMTAQPLAITRSWDASDNSFAAAIPVSRNDVPMAGNVRAGQSPAGIAVKVIHRGPYDMMGPSYEKLSAYMAANRLKEGRTSWEQYISDPGEVPAMEIITHIYFMIDNEQGDD